MNLFVIEFIENIIILDEPDTVARVSDVIFKDVKVDIVLILHQYNSGELIHGSKLFLYNSLYYYFDFELKTDRQ